MLVHKGKTVRVGYKIDNDGTKVRVAKPSGEVSLMTHDAPQPTAAR